MAITKVKPINKKKTIATKSKTNSRSRASNSNSTNTLRNKVNYNERLLASLYTVSRRKHLFKHGVHRNSLVSYLKKFTNQRLDTHTSIDEPTLKRARRELEENGLIEVKNGYFKLADSPREGIIHYRREKNDSDDDEHATTLYYKSTFPHSLVPRSKTPTRTKSTSTSTTAIKRKPTPNKKRVATKSLSDESSDEEIVVLKKPKITKKQKNVTTRKGMKVRKVGGKDEEVDENSDLTELDNSEEEVEEEESEEEKFAKKGRGRVSSSNKGRKEVSNAGLYRLTKAELVRRLEDASYKKGKEGEEEVDDEKDAQDGEKVQNDLLVLSKGFKKLQDITQRYKSRLEQYEAVLEDDDGNPISPVLEAVEDEEDLGRMDDDFFDNNDIEDSGFYELNDAASNADTEVSNSEVVEKALDPIFVEQEVDVEIDTGFDSRFPELNMEREGSSSSLTSSKRKLHEQKKELQSTQSFTSNLIPSPAPSHVGAGNSRSQDGNFTDDEDVTSRTHDHLSQRDSRALLTPVVTSSPDKSYRGDLASTSFVGTSEQPRSSSMERGPEGAYHKLVEEIEILKEELKLFEVERERERDSLVESKVSLEEELRVMNGKYQDLVESRDKEMESLREKLKDAKDNLKHVNDEKVYLKVSLEDAEIDLSESRDENITINSELVEAKKQITLLETRYQEQLDQMQEAASVHQFEKSQLISDQAELEIKLATVETSMSIKPSVDVSVETGEDPAFETLRIELTLEQQVAIDSLNKEFELVKEQLDSSSESLLLLKSENDSLKLVIETERENHSRLKLDRDLKEKDLTEAIAQSSQKVAELKAGLDLLKKQIEDGAALQNIKLIEYEGLVATVQSLTVEKENTLILLSNTQQELNDLTLRGIEFAAQNTNTIAALQGELKSNSEKLSSLVQNLAILSTPYGIDFSTEDPQSSLVKLATRLQKIDITSHELSRSIMETISARINASSNDIVDDPDIILEVGDSDLTLDLKKIKSKLSAYLVEVARTESTLEESKEQLDSRNSLIREIVSKTGELEQVCDANRKEIHSEGEIIKVVELAKKKISELEEKLTKSMMNLESMREEKTFASLEIVQKSSDLARAVDELKSYRRTSLAAYRKQGEMMGWNTESKEEERVSEDDDSVVIGA